MLTKEEYSALYYIEKGRNNLDRLKGMFDSVKEVNEILQKLEGDGLIKIQIRDGEIYGFMESKEGMEELKSSQYKEWYEELGD